MDTTTRTTTSSEGDVTEATHASRRSFLLGTGTAAAGAVLFAACGSGRTENTGISGSPLSTTSVAPTVPTTEPNQAALDDDATQINTAASLELLAAAVYDEYGGRFTDTGLAEAADRFAADHRAAAQVFTAEMEDPGSAAPNEFLQKNLVDPIEGQLNSDTAVANFFSGLESSIAATYISATGVFTSAEWRQRIMTYGAASARRAAALGDGGSGSAPDEAMYPLTDLIPGNAFVKPEGAAAAE